jgi:hypothetical protein
MDILLNKNDLEKVNTLIETKEINIAVSDMLLTAFYYPTIVNKTNLDKLMKEQYLTQDDAIINLVLDFLEIDLDNEENESLINIYFKDIQELDNKIYENNPYVKTVKPKEISDKNFKIKFMEYGPYQLFARDEINVIDEDFKEISKIGYFKRPYKYLAILIGSGIAGLAGCFFILDYIQGGYDSYYIMESLGWLSVALVIFTLWKPNLAIFGSILFGALYILPNANIIASITAQTAIKKVIELIPYLVTILVLLFISITGSKQAQPPASLGNNYFREER